MGDRESAQSAVTGEEAAAFGAKHQAAHESRCSGNTSVP